ncbi:MAG: SDR family oxidoreductase [Candidatus Obscuribacterales bacterium]|nr:SDR family oxidoreductase [Candidatus Obscuribacterales bacterium]
MDLKLSGKKALVTGSTAGIGLAIAELLAKEGAHVYINGRSAARVDEAVKTIIKKTGSSSVSGIAADLGNAAGAKELIAKLPEIEILINNMGVYEAKDFFQITDEDWLAIYEANVLSGVRLSRHYLPQMLKKNWGRIIFISSESGVQTPAEMIHYGMSKTAQLAISRGLAELTGGSNVTVNSVLPGPTKSEGVDVFLKQIANERGVEDPSKFEKELLLSLRPSSLLKRFAGCEEVANMVAYLVSELASATNGSAIRVDGGTVRSIV